MYVFKIIWQFYLVAYTRVKSNTYRMTLYPRKTACCAFWDLDSQSVTVWCDCQVWLSGVTSTSTFSWTWLTAIIYPRLYVSSMWTHNGTRYKHLGIQNWGVLIIIQNWDFFSVEKAPPSVARPPLKLWDVDVYFGPVVSTDNRIRICQIRELDRC